MEYPGREEAAQALEIMIQRKKIQKSLGNHSGAKGQSSGKKKPVQSIWTKVFLGLFAGSASIAAVIGISLIAQKARKRRRRNIQHRSGGHSRGQIHRTSSRSQNRKPPRKPQSRRTSQKSSKKRPSEKAQGRRPAGKNQTEKSFDTRRARGRVQKMPAHQEQPVWKGKEPYVRKRRKIG